MMRAMFAVILATSFLANATPTNTDRFILALADSLAERVIGDDELVLLIEAAERGEVLNPICEATAELSSERLLAYEVFKTYVDGNDLDMALVTDWARDNLVAQERGRKKRDESRDETTFPWKKQARTFLSAGSRHTCAVTTDGMVECWGDDEHGQVSGHKGLNLGPVQSVSAGEKHTCTVKADGRVECWGYDVGGESSGHKKLNLGVVQSVSAGGGHTCAVKAGGMVECWGNDEFRQSSGHKKLNLGAVQSVSAGEKHTCAVKADGTIECWGYDFSGSVSGHKKLNPGPLHSVSASGYHTCGVRADGVVECWGWDINRQVSEHNGLNLGPVRSVSAGLFHSCAVKASGIVECWGDDEFGQVSGYEKVDAHVMRHLFWWLDGWPLGPVQSVSAGAHHTCVVKVNGTVVCWGDDRYGQLKVPEGLVVMSRSQE